MIKFTFSGNGATYKIALPWGFILSGWLFMLLMGILHLHVSPVIPPIGYGLSVLIMFLVQLISWCHSGD